MVILLDPFPTPQTPLHDRLDDLRKAATHDKQARARVEEADDLDRPWDLATLSGQLRQMLWLWCDDVVDWINRSYAWRPAQLIPACWPRHPHIAAELPAVACQRYSAARAFSADELDRWHRETLPGFLDRMADRLGDGCRSGAHADWPAAARHDAYRAATGERRQLYHDEVASKPETTNLDPARTEEPS